ncbi:DUF1579 family protein [Parasphingopyxis sp.]|uniref:DUF1579 family protein n=1 Tax=Parasphingopyxis sp. TaxID=1920299 RepID=UPI00260A42A2|nr:DUF1579 family protein [uncultured Parasphingopyxis sp.]
MAQQLNAKTLLLATTLLLFCTDAGGAVGTQAEAFIADRRSSTDLQQQHDHLAAMAGRYTLSSTVWFSPDVDPVDTELAATRSIVLGGRVLELHVEGLAEVNDAFEGRGFTGYDTSLQQHWYVWMDTTGTGVATLHGRLAADGTGQLEGSVTNRIVGQSTPLRVQIHREGNAEIHDYFSPDMGGEEARWMRLVYRPLR